MRIQSAGCTDKGRVRLNNEDNLYINDTYRQDVDADNLFIEFEGTEGYCSFAVFDGMGGESSGEVASLRAAQVLSRSEKEHLHELPGEYIQQANRRICEEIENNGGKQMGTTVALLTIYGDRAMACNVGDSRIYRLRNGYLEQLSVDHTQVQQLVDTGILSKSDAREHPMKHVLTQHLGIREEEFIVEPHMCNDIKLESGDVYLLCSDGLTDMLTDDEIRAVLKKKRKASKLVQKLIDAALSAGGRDNTTVIVVKII